MKYSISEDLKKELSELKIRAKELGYKNAFPKLPKEQYSQQAFNNVMMGFEKRLQNWKKGLLQLEDPIGNFNHSQRINLDKSSVKKLETRHFVTNSFEDLEELTED